MTPEKGRAQKVNPATMVLSHQKRTPGMGSQIGWEFLLHAGTLRQEDARDAQRDRIVGQAETLDVWVPQPFPSAPDGNSFLFHLALSLQSAWEDMLDKMRTGPL